MGFAISNMLDPGVYDHVTGDIELIETHISWVLLTGEFAYKIKKPVNFGFLDFSTLDNRRRYCEQEIDLNRRMAADLYLEVVAISDSGGSLTLSSSGNTIEYAVKMRQFPQSSQLDNMLRAGELSSEHMEKIARMVATFHAQVRVAAPETDYGTAESVYRPFRENFYQIRQHFKGREHDHTLSELEQWGEAQFQVLREIFAQRKRDGFVRECHGDMHLRNLLVLDDKPVAFDCIEFNPELRWIDVINDVAFLVMDLHDRQQQRLANRFLNIYLELTGDFEGLSVLPFYLCYRALVRAKVDALRIEQAGISEQHKSECREEFASYLELAGVYAGQRTPAIVIMRGVSASGKSTISQSLVDRLGAIRIRSDVERKRLFDIDATQSGQDPSDASIYTEQANRETYQKLVEIASGLIGNGYSVIADAAFLEYQQRELFETLSEKLNVPFIILEIRAPEAELRRRILNRKHDISDADLSVLEQQLKRFSPLRENEKEWSIPVNTAEHVNLDMLAESIQHFRSGC